MMNYLILFLYLTAFCYFSSEINAVCLDSSGRIFNEGEHFVPAPETSCALCICNESAPKNCRSLPCPIPQGCNSFTVGNGCCKFECLDKYYNRLALDQNLINSMSNASSKITNYNLLIFIILRWFLKFM